MGNLKIGWAARNVSTESPVNIQGQFCMRISLGVSDPLYATALALDDGKDAVIFLSIDIAAIRGGMLDDIRAAARAINPEIPAEKILANATHTHEAPAAVKADFKMAGSGYQQSEMPLNGMEVEPSNVYREFLIKNCAEAVDEAWNKRSEGGIAYGYGYAVVGHSRRVVYFDDISKRGGNVDSLMVDGYGKMYGNTNDSQFSHYEAGADHFINILYTFDPIGKLTGAVVNVPCPSQSSEHDYKLSADFWHEIRGQIREKHGDIFILPQCAAGGDLSPRILHYKKAQERRFRLKHGDMEHNRAERADIAGRVAVSFDEVLSWAKKDIKSEIKITHRVETIDLNKRLVTEDEYKFAKEGLAQLAGEQYKTSGDTPENMLTYNSVLVSRRLRYERVIERYDGQASEKTIPLELHVVKVGDIAFASNIFELYMDYMHRIQARSPFEQTFVVQLAGTFGELGGTYLPTIRGAQAKGYSASVFCNTVSPEGGQQLVEETVRVLNEIYE